MILSGGETPAFQRNFYCDAASVSRKERRKQMIKTQLKKLNGISVEEEQKTEKLCSCSKENIAAKLFRDMFITQKEQTEISEMREIMKRFPLKESK